VILLLLLLPRILAPGESTQGYERVPPPRVEMRQNSASATAVPWIDSNAWRYMRGTKKAYYPNLPAGAASVAAAEAYAWGVDAILEPAKDDLPALTQMLEFLKSIDAPHMPTKANIGIIDDGTPEMAEVLNLLSRRNLSYRVEKAPDAKLDLNVKVGSDQYPRESIKNPSDFAARVREKLSDNKRVIRVFNSYTVLANYTEEGGKARIHLVNYGRRPAKDLRIRVLGTWANVKLSESANRTQQAQDITTAEGGTEFTIPQLTTYAAVDLERKR
jgi:hypothetical protein